MKIILILFLLFSYTTISSASEKQTDATKVTENPAAKNLTSEKTVTKDKAAKNKSENVDEATQTDATRPPNILSRFFSTVKKFFGNGGEQKSQEQIKTDKSPKDIAHNSNYDYFVDEDGDGICDGKCLNRQRRQRMGYQRSRGRN